MGSAHHPRPVADPAQPPRPGVATSDAVAALGAWYEETLFGAALPSASEAGYRRRSRTPSRLAALGRPAPRSLCGGRRRLRCGGFWRRGGCPPGQPSGPALVHEAGGLNLVVLQQPEAGPQRHRARVSVLYGRWLAAPGAGGRRAGRRSTSVGGPGRPCRRDGGGCLHVLPPRPARAVMGERRQGGNPALLRCFGRHRRGLACLPEGRLGRSTRGAGGRAVIGDLALCPRFASPAHS